jgi:hypothetical protein
MPLINVNADFSRVATALERIADLLEMKIDPQKKRRESAVPLPKDGKPRITQPTDEDYWFQEQEDMMRQQSELAAQSPIE